LQHGDVEVQSWPYSEQPPPLLDPLPPPEPEPLPPPEPLPLPEPPPLELPLPASGLGPPHGPHVPLVLPCAIEQNSPAQQSALVVHAPHEGMHCTAEHTRGGVPPSAGAGLGTHGAPLQQSALVEQPLPAFTHWASAQRGTPSLSVLHVSMVSQLPEQQSHVALQLMVASLHTAPLGSQLRIERLHTPTVAGGVIEQPTYLPLFPPAPGYPSAPQQSLSCVQRSPIV
jgi:hypothetical protein